MNKEKSTNRISGFKGFDSELKCRNMQYAIGQEFEIDKEKELKVCPDNDKTQGGLHFCENPLNVFDYYPPATSRYCEVVGSGESQRESSDSKVASSRLFIKAEITLKNLIDAAVKFTFEKVDWVNAKESNTGYQSAATVEGMESVAISIGIEGRAKGKKGCFIVLADWSRDEESYINKRTNVLSFLIDGEAIKEDTFYTIKNGILSEVK